MQTISAKRFSVKNLGSKNFVFDNRSLTTKLNDPISLGLFLPLIFLPPILGDVGWLTTCAGSFAEKLVAGFRRNRLYCALGERVSAPNKSVHQSGRTTFSPIVHQPRPLGDLGRYRD